MVWIEIGADAAYMLIFQVVQWEWDVRNNVEEDKDNDIYGDALEMIKIIRLINVFWKNKCFLEEDDDG